MSGIIKISHPITAYATIGGQGNYSINSKVHKFDDNNMIKGGYGGGGNAYNYYLCENDYGTGSGGGQTSVKFLTNDLWHRVIVAGAGGWSDNSYTESNYVDDGSGGLGGGFIAQGYWVDGVLNSDRIANSTFGFTFGSGESARQKGSLNPYGQHDYDILVDRPGAGSGWFGGFAGHHGNAGSGGGSSWALSAEAIFPEGEIYANGSFYNETESHPYFFSLNDGYVFTEVKTYPGVWVGNGRLVITVLDSIICPSCACFNRISFMYELLFVLVLETNAK
ncbi:glycine rich protein, putative [Trichomonas vaginalis G3]|uniref:receptor protein-tyrosine kinase n=1 Tax=Trichomonas vaginalis (strain ATCC PRA-98 / G3) TaxID=412133 RepID=A2E0I1_TRIV3|nr:glycine-rich protein family [Trichomonas vaginalis G3]EAY13861.1 glycine rich protein, putative [Trichomonas vaginalis G3]KAI5520437.1 glycine-rich protein family [Trichomonas vaginalis G3]|eukprot:XP_001326084.1 glycine rich protein [Trichomonas vaginalis G3]